jgi:1,4-alpha-glucan branching enzyme
VKKTKGKNGKTSVTFELPPDIVAGKAVVIGDFNGWEGGVPMKRRRDGSFSTTLRLGPGRYRYRYLLDDERWENDWAADAYEPNSYGSEDSVLEVTPPA